MFSSPHPAAVLLAVDAYDWRLWIDTIDHGGFDLIAKPFCGVEEKLNAAAQHWRDGRVRRTWDHFFQR